MTLSDIILSKLSPTDKPQDVFLALEITSEFVVAALWTVADGKTQLVHVGVAKEWEEEKELLLAVDESISSFPAIYTKKIQGVVFGLEEGWVEKNSIVQDKKPLLKQICEKLELKPLGFVVITESLVQYLKITEGLPLSAILINLEQSQAIVTLIKLGKIIKVETVGRSDDISLDLKEALVRFGEVDSFPSRILLFDGLNDFEEARQQIISYDWQKDLPFLHFPKVDILENDIPIKAIAIAGGSEIAKSLGFNIKEEGSPPSVNEPPVTTQKSVPLLTEIPANIDQPVNTEPVVSSTDSEEETSGQPEVQVNNHELKEPQEEALPKVDHIGFFHEHDVLNEEPMVLPTEKPTSETEKPLLAETVQSDAKPSVETPRAIENLTAVSSSDLAPKAKRTPLLKKLKAFKLPTFRLKLSKSWLLGLVPLLFFGSIFCLGFIAYWFLPRAEITLYFNRQITESEVTVSGDTTISQVDVDNEIIPIRRIPKEVSGTKTITTTGKSLIGDKAKGKVVIYNKTNLPKKFPKETVLYGPNGLTFYLDQEVEIASKSAQQSNEGEQIVYGKTEVAITAAKIGAEYNLKKDIEFTVKDYSKGTFSAMVLNDLGGGTSREVAAISEEDMTNLFNQLKEELLKQTSEDSSQQKEGEKVFVPDQEAEVLEKEYDKKAGDEGENLTLTLKLGATSYVYSDADLQLLVASKVLNSIPEGFNVEKTEIDQFEVQPDGKDKLSIKASAKAILIPKIDTEQIKEQIKGKYPNRAEEYFNTLANFNRADIKIFPSFFPAKLRTFPRRPERISISIKTT
jgi:hypothetical protein